MANHSTSPFRRPDTTAHPAETTDRGHITGQPMVHPAKNTVILWQSRHQRHREPLTFYTVSDQSFDKTEL